jgi:hypothetical protein
VLFSCEGTRRFVVFIPARAIPVTGRRFPFHSPAKGTDIPFEGFSARQIFAAHAGSELLVFD